MSLQEKINFDRIAEAIVYIQDNFQKQPSLLEIAENAAVSPFHFQRLFQEWAGVSPKKFLQYISLHHAKKLLREYQLSLENTSFEIGLSSTSRLHDLFVSVEGMSPAEYKNGGENLQIYYSTALTPFGEILVASTLKGICFLSFENTNTALKELQKIFPCAYLSENDTDMHHNALKIFKQDWHHLKQVRLHLKGTPFQLKVWECLLKIPFGKLASYQDIAKKIEQPTASRAVGTAIGNNPIAFLIPCHRIIQANGHWGNYRWGHIRKTAMIGWESAMTIPS